MPHDMIQKKRNTCIQLVKVSNRVFNEVRASESESAIHRRTKEDICRTLDLQGKHYITEARFVKGGRADILILDDFRVIEIAVSESEESLINKGENYPEGLKIEVVRC